MKKIREFLKNETIRNFLTILKVFLMVIASYLYLMYANLFLSTSILPYLPNEWGAIHSRRAFL